TPQMNFINAVLEKKDGKAYVSFEGHSLSIPDEKANDPALADYYGKDVVIGIRPECIHDEEIFMQKFSDNVIDVDVDVTELMGAEIYLYLAVGEQNLTARVSSRSQARAGDKISIAIETARIHIFDKDTQKCLVH
ncbi:MAG: TOBE domain-containing protein, partial [Clostridia bacterium]|nr:TOBE domain-containing protein [Clostridia bacterium]